MPAGRPRIMDNATLIELYEQFCEEVVSGGFCVLPTKTRFTAWLKIRELMDRATFYRYFSEFCDTEKSRFYEALSDTLTEGAAVGRYNNTMIIFCLKNWCGWSDGKREISATVSSTSEVTASSKLLKALLDDNSTRKGE